MLSHHAVLQLTAQLKEAVQAFKNQADASCEIVPYEVDALTIEDVRRVIALAYQTPGSYSTRVIVIAARSINREAQHALLKVLEEPPQTTQFLIILPTAAGLLPTVLSRVMLDSQSANRTTLNDFFVSFLVAAAKDRLELIADIAKRKNEADYDKLYDGLVTYSARHNDIELLAPAETAIRFLRQKGAAKKMIWEHLALTLPVESKR